jgi:hypothetical protein
MYGLPRKFEASQNYSQLWELNFLIRPTARELARESNVGSEYAAKVILEIHLHNEIIAVAGELSAVGAPCIWSGSTFGEALDSLGLFRCLFVVAHHQI